MHSSGDKYLRTDLREPKQKDKEDLEEISTELELVDEEEKVPYVFPSELVVDSRNLHKSDQILATSSATPSSSFHSPKSSHCWKIQRHESTKTYPH